MLVSHLAVEAVDVDAIDMADESRGACCRETTETWAEGCPRFLAASAAPDNSCKNPSLESMVDFQGLSSIFIAMLSERCDGPLDPKLRPELAFLMVSRPRGRLDRPMPETPRPLPRALRPEYLADSMPVRPDIPLIPLKALSFPTSLIRALFPIVEEIGSEIALMVLMVLPPALMTELAGS
jgi:hypothetical protein